MIMAAATVISAACSQEDLTSSYHDDPNAVQISVQVGEGDVSGGFVTLSTPVGTTETEGRFNSGDRISVSTTDQGPVVYAYDGSRWNPENSEFLKWTSDRMTFTAYYPVSPGVDSDNFSVPTDQSDADKIADADYMTCFASKARTEGDNGVILPMERKMARIVITPTLQNQFDGYTVTDVIVHGNTSGYSGGTTTTGEIAVKAYKHTDGSFYALLSPTTADEGSCFIEITISYDNVSETLHAIGIPAAAAGNSYTVNLAVGRNVAEITGISINEWTSGSITEGEALHIPYVTFSAENAQTFLMDFKPSGQGLFILGEGEYFEYSVGGGKWTRFTTTISEPVDFGGENGNLRLRGKSSKGTSNMSTQATIQFTNSLSPVRCTGDIRTLIDYENYATTSTADARFISLFSGCDLLTTAPELPAMTLADNCYSNMFNSCKKLTTAPELPAIEIGYFCYANMFKDCSSLTEAPELPAKQLKGGCYFSMFKGCLNLKTAPVIHATTLADNCCVEIFNGCLRLENVTMLATEGFNKTCLLDWLGDNAGKLATNRTLTLANEEVYNRLITTEYFITNYWKASNENTTVIYQNNQ